MTWPAIPRLLRGAGGPIKVRLVKQVRRTLPAAWGQWNDATRTIRIDKAATPEHRWRVLFHELTHAALNDAGIENMTNEAALEAFCDAIATAAIQAMRGELGMID